MKFCWKGLVVKMKNDLYICYTQFHLLIAIIKCLKSENRANLIISSDNFNDSLISEKNIIDNLKFENIFEDIITYDPSKEQLKLRKKKFYYLSKYLYIQKEIRNCNIDLKKYDNIYIFNDVLLLGRCINYKKIRYHLIEDGTDCFKNNKVMIKGKSRIRAFVKNVILGLYDMGESKNIIDIEVNDMSNIFIKKQNIIEKSKKQLFCELTKDDKEIIKRIFLKDNDLEKYDNFSLIITQPLYEDNFLKSEIEKVRIYKSIIEEYCKGEKYVIKTHPREKTDYSKFFKNVINYNFPLEIINFIDDLQFNKVITISSTSINIINNCNEKIFLGWEWLNEQKKDKK